MTTTRRAYRFPPPLQRRLEAHARAFMQADDHAGVDFSQPPGEPALTRPDSVSWRVFKNPLTLFIGGVAAVVLELAEARVRTGVWEHTGFRHDPLRRLRRTGFAALMTVYGPRSRTMAMIAGIRSAHARVTGITPDGRPYSANDPELLRWVHATAGFGFLEAYATWACPLESADRDRFYAEGVAAAELYGVQGAPASEHETQALFDAMYDKLEPSPVVVEFLDIMCTAPLLPRPFAPLQRLLVHAAVDLLPHRATDVLKLEARARRLPDWQRKLVRALAMQADRIVLASAPPAQSCRRLSLPVDYLYRP